MLFSSFSFLFWFLPTVLALYFLPALLPGRRSLAWQNGVLLVASLLFYAWGEPLYVFLMIGLIAADTLTGVLLARTHSRALLALAVAGHVGLLILFKYLSFFAGLVGLSLTAPRLPIGISFYTFQALSYLVDVYRRDVLPERNPATFGVYLALFPQLIAGPIVRYTDVDRALHERTHTVAGAADGARRFSAGLAKKVLLANPMGALFTHFTALPELSLVGALGALLGFSFQIYFDFSGYSDMAIGLGRIFGFDFPENFRYPYIAKSITDFWRRWHITLSSFFREYVYIPLGGNRRGRARTVLNLFVVWTLTGLWHGAAWSFVLWGVYYFVLLALEKFVLARFLPRLPLFLRHALTLLAISLGWMLFAFDGSTAALCFAALGRFLGALVGQNGLVIGADLYDLLRHLPLLALCALDATPLPRKLYARCAARAAWLTAVLPICALLLAVIELSDAGFNPFLYFRF